MLLAVLEWGSEIYIYNRICKCVCVFMFMKININQTVMNGTTVFPYWGRVPPDYYYSRTPTWGLSGDQIFIPQNKKNLKWELYQNRTENYSFIYKNIIFTLHLNLVIFFSQLYIYVFVFTLWDKRKNLKNKLELDFHCTGYSVHPIIWQQIRKQDKM